MSMFRHFVSVMGQAVDVTSHADGETMAAAGAPSRIHAGCGGQVDNDADFISGDGDEIWWNYRCGKCQETFRDSGEWL
jgi:hypothetical protein